MKSLTKDWRK